MASDTLTLDEVCTLAGVDRSNLWRWRTMGLLPEGRYFNRGDGSGRQVVFPKAETVAAIKHVKAQRARGLSLAAIADEKAKANK